MSKTYRLKFKLQVALVVMLALMCFLILINQSPLTLILSLLIFILVNALVGTKISITTNGLNSNCEIIAEDLE